MYLPGLLTFYPKKKKKKKKSTYSDKIFVPTLFFVTKGKIVTIVYGD